ncbi:hypothetical protein F5148DRAFT_1147504 [Russula earlei]|uniref:Uncharacterized protein n=1 Tax=Russula earlei TaxID=71964 RepID=A0ACC0UHH2_9AGAM|nr:hypothetical protein F5148DRAFT_1147504 [Russula earlei]
MVSTFKLVRWREIVSWPPEKTLSTTTAEAERTACLCYIFSKEAMDVVATSGHQSAWPKCHAGVWQAGMWVWVQRQEVEGVEEFACDMVVGERRVLGACVGRSVVMSLEVEERECVLNTQLDLLKIPWAVIIHETTIK